MIPNLKRFHCGTCDNCKQQSSCLIVARVKNTSYCMICASCRLTFAYKLDYNWNVIEKNLYNDDGMTDAEFEAWKKANPPLELEFDED